MPDGSTVNSYVEEVEAGAYESGVEDGVTSTKRECASLVRDLIRSCRNGGEIRLRHLEALEADILALGE